ncbi:DNA-binding MarR family transcriptional regulator [Novosphingobium chloroacetimidivorans]|uniref:DNA-binding MarR family transcriptional regulator n=1 Tax=Novosphingobium chloroacetimidivorans TaxID=1428314 RepID=A0A7W7NWQ8_9SPHN|nr:MarR family winged helix-turn-helix transcriptional regulator [Novosphingobium chloroacetimidivorans]MBB4858664.1 DNA-binding MarR family transcriptional regulator [Novosphingobium chloroacetimidivorans]
MARHPPLPQIEAPIDAPFDLQSYVPALINILSASLSTSASVSYRRHVGLNVLEWRILVQLAQRDGLSAREVADKVCQNKAPVSRAIQVLEGRGLLRVEPAERGRRHRLSITGAGRDAYRAALPIAAARQQQLLAGLREDEIVQLRSFLARMIVQAASLADDIGPDGGT